MGSVTKLLDSLRKRKKGGPGWRPSSNTSSKILRFIVSYCGGGGAGLVRERQGAARRGGVGAWPEAGGIRVGAASACPEASKGSTPPGTWGVRGARPAPSHSRLEQGKRTRTPSSVDSSFLSEDAMRMMAMMSTMIPTDHRGLLRALRSTPCMFTMVPHRGRRFKFGGADSDCVPWWGWEVVGGAAGATTVRRFLNPSTRSAVR
mmetsp:Transcript_23184/g.72429  ORF Transcript_23184/g.72429 Transcript_23184/m.72429 type:complete len:204 (-) Transcript_23184:1143-1754(-)